MNIYEMAERINGRQYRKELSFEDKGIAKDFGLVIVYGASDDLMEFDGAICEELGAWEGTIAYLTANGLLQNECENEECPHFERLKLSAKTITAEWDKEGYSWIYRTVIPHACFDIMDDGEKYCRGIVFDMEDLQGQIA